MRKVVEKELLRKLRWMAGHTNPWLTHHVARDLRNTARELICETWPDSKDAADVNEWRKSSPDDPSAPTTQVEDAATIPGGE